jgi:hypothetical protein
LSIENLEVWLQSSVPKKNVKPYEQNQKQYFNGKLTFSFFRIYRKARVLNLEEKNKTGLKLYEKLKIV